MAKRKEPTAPGAIAWKKTLLIHPYKFCPGAVLIYDTDVINNSDKRYINNGFLPKTKKKPVQLNLFQGFISRLYNNAEISMISIPVVSITKGLLHNFLLIGNSMFQQIAIKINKQPVRKSF